MMDSDRITDARLRDWLLQRIPAAQAETLELRLLGDAAFAARLLDVEHDLIDAHARGQLDAADREAVRQHLLADDTGRRRHRLALALTRAADARVGAPVSPARHGGVGRLRAILQRLDRQGGRRRLLRVAALVVLLVAIALFGTRFDTAPTPPPRVLARVDGAIGEGSLPTISLLADVSRGARYESLALPVATQLRLQLEVADPEPDGRYTLSISDGNQALHDSGALDLQQAGSYRFVEAIVPTAALGPGLRRVALRRTSAAGVTTTTWILHTTAPR